MPPTETGQMLMGKKSSVCSLDIQLPGEQVCHMEGCSDWKRPITFVVCRLEELKLECCDRQRMATLPQKEVSEDTRVVHRCCICCMVGIHADRGIFQDVSEY